MFRAHQQKQNKSKNEKFHSTALQEKFHIWVAPKYLKINTKEEVKYGFLDIKFIKKINRMECKGKRRDKKENSPEQL